MLHHVVLHAPPCGAPCSITTTLASGVVLLLWFFPIWLAWKHALLRYKDTLKDILKRYGVLQTWKDTADNRPEWRSVIYTVLLLLLVILV